MPRPEAVSMSEAGRRLGVSRQRVHQMAGYGLLRTTKRGGKRMVLADSITEAIERKVSLTADCMSTVEVAAKFGVDPKTVRGWRDRNLLSTTKINNRLCFDRKEVNHFTPPSVVKAVQRARAGEQSEREHFDH